jgi:TetR/AcrR family transcriptional regulator, cholesterol catabolism regulator
VKNRKDHIEQTARNLFRQNGYAATSMRDLAEGVGIEAASLYSHIKSKEEILQSICFKMADDFFDAMESVELSGYSPEKKLYTAIKKHLEVIAENRDAAAVFFHDWRHLSEPFLSDFKQMRRRYENSFRQLINDGIDSGAFKKGDAKFIVLTIFSAMNWTYDWYNPKKKLNATDLANDLCSIILYGLKK